MTKTRRTASGKKQPIAIPYSMTGTVSALDLQSLAKRIARKGGRK